MTEPVLEWVYSFYYVVLHEIILFIKVFLSLVPLTCVIFVR